MAGLSSDLTGDTSSATLGEGGGGVEPESDKVERENDMVERAAFRR